MNLTLSARLPFNFLSVVHSHGWMQLAPFRFDEDSKSLFYTDRLSDHRVLEYRMSEASQGVKVFVDGTLNKAEQNEVKERITWMFGLDQDFSSFYKVARREPKLRKAEKLARGRVLRCPSFFEDVVKMICTTNCSWALTEIMIQNLVGSFGKSFDGSIHSFPSPETLAASSDAFLRKEIKSGYRSFIAVNTSSRI